MVHDLGKWCWSLVLPKKDASTARWTRLDGLAAANATTFSTFSVGAMLVASHHAVIAWELLGAPRATNKIAAIAFVECATWNTAASAIICSEECMRPLRPMRFCLDYKNFCTCPHFEDDFCVGDYPKPVPCTGECENVFYSLNRNEKSACCTESSTRSSRAS
jgi:hypothetical protein